MSDYQARLMAADPAAGRSYTHHDTETMISRIVSAHPLARDGVLGAPVLINAGRGGLQVEADILSALDDGTLGGTSLDVFETEPLPTVSRLWTHPKVVVTPHNAADSEPEGHIVREAH